MPSDYRRWGSPETLADKGVNLVILARRSEPQVGVATQIRPRGGVHVTTVAPPGCELALAAYQQPEILGDNMDELLPTVRFNWK